MHGGSEALAADGERYVDVIDPVSQTRIGWVNATKFGQIGSIKAHNQDWETVRTRRDNSITYGAPLGNISTLLVGCNATTLTFSNPSASVGLAVVLGEATPTGRAVGSREIWSAPGGGTLYVAPGDTAAITVTTGVDRTWHFAELDADLQARARRDTSGVLVAPAEALDVRTIDVAQGSCSVDDAAGDPELQEFLPGDESSASLPPGAGEDSTANLGTNDSGVQDPAVGSDSITDSTNTDPSAPAGSVPANPAPLTPAGPDIQTGDSDVVEDFGAL